MMRAPRSRNRARMRSPCAVCDGSSDGREVVMAVALANVGAIEADEVIDAEAVVEIGAAAGALPQPVVVVVAHRVPAVHRQSPVLSGLGECVGRHADRRVDTKLMLPGPDVGAVAADHEGKVAEDADAAALAAGAAPLGVGQPLQILVIQDGVGEPLARCDRARADRGRAARAPSPASSSRGVRRAARGTGRSRRATSARVRRRPGTRRRAPFPPQAAAGRRERRDERRPASARARCGNPPPRRRRAASSRARSAGSSAASPPASANSSTSRSAMKTGSMAIALRAEYGEFCPSSISLTGSNWTRSSPAADSQRANGGRSAISPTPQLARDGMEKSGTSTPA